MVSCLPRVKKKTWFSLYLKNSRLLIQVTYFILSSKQQQQNHYSVLCVAHYWNYSCKISWLPLFTNHASCVFQNLCFLVNCLNILLLLCPVLSPFSSIIFKLQHCLSQTIYLCSYYLPFHIFPKKKKNRTSISIIH